MATQRKTLEMVFKTVQDREVVISLLDPKDAITAAEVDATMNLIISKNIFATTYGDLIENVEARVRVVDVTLL